MVSDFLRWLLLLYKVNRSCFSLQMGLEVHMHGSSQEVGFININYLLVCLRQVSTHLINTDIFLFVIMHTLIFSGTHEFRTCPAHSLINEARGLQMSPTPDLLSSTLQHDSVSCDSFVHLSMPATYSYRQNKLNALSLDVRSYNKQLCVKLNRPGFHTEYLRINWDRIIIISVFILWGILIGLVLWNWKRKWVLWLNQLQEAPPYWNVSFQV